MATDGLLHAKPLAANRPMKKSKNHDLSTVERKLKQALKGMTSSRLRVKMESGVVVVTGDVIADQALDLIDNILDELPANLEFDNRVRVRARSNDELETIDAEAG